MSGSHKQTVEEFTKIVNSRHVHHLEKVLEENVEKKENSKVVFKNLQEAREYYSMEHEAHPSNNYNIVQFQESDQDNNNILKAKINYSNHTYDTTYTFSPAGKIQTIQSVIQQ